MSKKTKRRNFFALLIRDDELQLAQVDRKGRPTLTATQPLEEGVVDRGKLVDRPKLTAHLKALLAAKKPKKKFVAVGLPEVASFSRTIKIESVSPEEMDDAVRWESEPLLPFPLKKAYLDWMWLTKGDEKKEPQVLVMALPSPLVDGYAEVLEELGYQLVAFEPTSLSLARLAPRGQGEHLVIEISPKEATLVLVGPTGEINLSSTVAFKAEKKSEEILDLVQNAVRFYRRRFGKEAKLDKVWLCGRGAEASLVGQVKEKTEIETQLLGSKLAGFEIAASLAQKDVAAPRDETTINLIPPRIQSIYDQAQKSQQTSRWLRFWLFGLFLAVFTMGVMTARVYFETKRVEGEIIDLQAAAMGGDNVGGQARLLQTRTNRVLANFAQTQNPAVVFKLIRDSASHEIEISHLVYNFVDGMIHVDGRANTRASLVEFREKLEATGQFSLVRIPLSSLEKERNAEFTLTLSQN